MQFPVAQAVINDGSWCFKALLHLAVHLVSTARFSLGPSVFLLWLTGSKNSKHGAHWLPVKWQLQAHRISLLNVHCFISHSIFCIYNACGGLCMQASRGWLTLFACKSDLSHLVLIWCSELALWQLQYKQERLMWIACFLRHISMCCCRCWDL